MLKLSALTLFFVACSPIGQFSKRASFELQCPEEQLEFTNLQESGTSRKNKQTWGVRGCGKQATYQKHGRIWSNVNEIPTATN